MTSTSRYHLIRYWAQGVILKHYQIRDGTHAVILKHCLIRDNAQNVLSKPYCEHVYSSDNFLSRYTLLSFFGKRRAKETCCFRVMCLIQEMSTYLSPEWRYAQAINQILTTWEKEQYLQCKVGLFLRTVKMICSEFVKNGIREVACA
ncbi:MAG: hypothetical protein NTW33_01065 [Methanoregula sp.]|nr:hypothetical protein [Methanoregula sp.]